MGEERETEWEKWAKCHECFLISCLSSCFHISKRPACGELVNFAALVVHSHPLCVAVARPPHISLTYISTATVAPLIFARRAPSHTESGHCRWWRKSTSFIHCQKNHHPCGDNLLSPGSLTVHLEFTPGDSGDERIFFFFFLVVEVFGMSGPRVTTTHAPLLVPFIHHCIEACMGTEGFLPEPHYLSLNCRDKLDNCSSVVKWIIALWHKTKRGSRWGLWSSVTSRLSLSNMAWHNLKEALQRFLDVLAFKAWYSNNNELHFNVKDTLDYSLIFSCS